VADVPDERHRSHVWPVRLFHKFAGKDIEDKRPRDRYVGESKRLLGVLDQRLRGRQWIMGDDYSVVDIATFPWVRNLIGFYGAGDLVEIERSPKSRASCRASSRGLQ
jgi:GST-like protein